MAEGVGNDIPEQFNCLETLACPGQMLMYNVS